MKRITILVLLVFTVQLSLSQKVHSIKVEQTGDFIKIGYKILDSKPGQIYRVKVLCSIDGRLNTEIVSLSGDYGDHVAGGKPEYWVIWDVLKDIDNLNSAEFIVRAELASDISSGSSSTSRNNTTGWDNKRSNIMIAALAPGPKVGLRIGFMGSFGISGQMTFGKTVVEENIVLISSDNYSPSNQFSLSLDLSKRIINKNGFQMHILIGFSRTRFTFLDYNASEEPYREQKVFGPEIGFAFGVKRLAFSLMATHFDPGQVEKGTDQRAISPLNYVSTSIGVRF